MMFVIPANRFDGGAVVPMATHTHTHTHTPKIHGGEQLCVPASVDYFFFFTRFSLFESSEDVGFPVSLVWMLCVRQIKKESGINLRAARVISVAAFVLRFIFIKVL